MNLLGEATFVLSIVQLMMFNTKTNVEGKISFMFPQASGVFIGGILFNPIHYHIHYPTTSSLQENIMLLLSK